MIGIDSNILIYAHNKASPYYVEAKELVHKAVEEDLLGISELSLREFYAVITDGRKVEKPFSPLTASTLLNNYFQSEKVHVCRLTDKVWQRALEYAAQYRLVRYDLDDLLIGLTLELNGVVTVYTKNVKDFKKFDFIQAINPFVSSAPRSPLPAPSFIPYGRQSITEQDVAAVCKVLRSDWLTQGPAVPAFEKAVADYCGAKHAVAVNSGTSALHLACLTLGVGPGDLVWTSPITFVASANCARYCGADVDFVDIDPRTYNLSPDRLAEKLKQAKADSLLPKVVIPVHLTGQPCDMAAIHALSQEYGFRIIEDACHAIGGRYKGEPIGNCRYSDITIFSFHPVKTITSAEGGMAVTNDPELAEQMALLRSHGITRDSSKLKAQSINEAPPPAPCSAPAPLNSRDVTAQRIQPGPPAWYYEQIALGFNYRMTDMQAALGLSQLTRLDEFVERRHSLAQRYNVLLANLPVTIPWQHPDTYSGRHLYVIRLKLNEIKKTRDQVFENLRSAGIGVNLHYIPVYRQPDFARIDSKPPPLRPMRSAPCAPPYGPCPETERYYAEAISLPLFPAMTDEDGDYVVETLRSAIL